MNLACCSNCLMHGWRQVEDPSELKQCSKCKLIQYCGEECQREHWKKVHKKHCRYFADAVKAQKWAHKEDDCAICIQSAQVGKDGLEQATNPNYECILKFEFPPSVYHPHPFPMNGKPGHTYEKGIILLWQLLKKFELTQPNLMSMSSCQEKMLQVYAELISIRLDIWKIRKVSHQPECYGLENNRPYSLDNLRVFIEDLENVWNIKAVQDPFQLWEIIRLVDGLLSDVIFSENLMVLLNPLADIPVDLLPFMSQAVSNSTKFLAKANQVFEALANHLVPYQDVLKIVCGDSLEKQCHFCSERTTIAFIKNSGTVSGKTPAVVVNCLYEIYCCRSDNCILNRLSMFKDYLRFLTALLATVRERGIMKCDFCFKLPSRKGSHRCSKCLTVMYCSSSCKDKDWDIHKEFCKRGAEERKIKFGSLGRRKGAMEELDKVGKELEKELEEIYPEEEKETNVQGMFEVVNKFKV